MKRGWKWKVEVRARDGPQGLKMPKTPLYFDLGKSDVTVDRGLCTVSDAKHVPTRLSCVFHLLVVGCRVMLQVFGSFG
jgi:hypothetical protein